jgi:hypothetical protein
MILRRLANAIRKQDWFTVLIEMLIVVLGVFLGLQVSNWNEAKQERNREAVVLEQLAREFTLADEEGKLKQVKAEASLEATREVLRVIQRGEEPDDRQAFLKTLGAAGGFESGPSEPVTLVELMSGGGGLSGLSSPELRTALIRYHEIALYQRRLSDIALQRVSTPNDGFHAAIHLNPDFSWELDNRLERYDWEKVAGTRQQFQVIMYAKIGISYGIGEQIVRGQAVLDEIERARK